MTTNKGWIGVDLDGTLAEYHGWKGISHVGRPIPAMVQKVRNLINEGYEVKIFTARVANPNSEEFLEVNYYIEKWCKEHLGTVLEVTATKDFGMIKLYDDRCEQIVTNTGLTIQEFNCQINVQDQQHQSTKSDT